MNHVARSIFLFGVFYLSGYCLGTTIIDTGFDSSEGWQQGDLVGGGSGPTYNPPVGTWYCYTPAGVYEKQAQIDFTDTKTTPKTGDGLVYIDRTPASVSDRSQNLYLDISSATERYLSVSGWVKTSTTSGNSVTFKVSNRAYTQTDALQTTLACVIINYSGNVGYMNRINDSSTEYIYTVTGALASAKWGYIELLLDTQEDTFSAWVTPDGGTKTVIIEGHAFTNASTYVGDPQSFRMGLGGGGWGALDDILITSSAVPEPLTASMFAGGCFLFLYRKFHRNSHRIK